MDQQKRLMIALGLSFVVLMVWTQFFGPKPVPPETTVDSGMAAASGPDAGEAAPSMAAVPASPATDGGQLAAVEEPPLPVTVVERKFPSVHYRLSSQGAGLVQAELQGKKNREQPNVSLAEGYKRLLGGEIPPPPQMNLAQPIPGEPLPLSVAIEGPMPFPADARYRADEGTPEASEASFTAKSGRWQVQKKLVWDKDGVQGTMALSVTNTSDQPAQGELVLHYGRAIDPSMEEQPSFFGGVGNLSHAACRVGEDLHKRGPSDDAPEEFKGAVSFFGIDQQYFLSALYPLDRALEGRCVVYGSLSARTVKAAFPLTVAPGQTVTQSFGLYLGPKDVEFLAGVGAAQAPKGGDGSAAAVAGYSPQLEATVDFGIWAFICKVLLTVLKFFHSVTGNWGVAIVLLTVLVKLVLLPLTHKSMVAAEGMKKLQPKMEELKKKYAQDKERLNAETMKMYQEHKVNPLGGCLPLLLQMPVWIALFTTLRNSFEIYQEPFINPIWTDLTFKDPTYIFPVLLGVTMVVTQKLQPQMMDETQAKIMTWFMPIFFTAIMLNYPAGLTLYIFTNNVLSIAQQYGLKKYLASREVLTPSTTGGKR